MDKRSVPDKTSKSDQEEEKIVTDPHTLVSTYFSSPTWCRVCDDFIWGITKSQQDGLKCTVCNVSVHSRCTLHVGNCVKPILSVSGGQVVIPVAEPFESSNPGQCSSYLYIKTMGNTKKWVQLKDGNLHYYNKKGEDQKLEEIQLLHINEVIGIEPGVLQSLCGFEIVFPGILNDNLIFYCDSVEDREYWRHHLHLVIKIKKQSIEEKITQYLWSDLLPYNKNEEISNERGPEMKSETENFQEKKRERDSIMYKENNKEMDKEKENEKERDSDKVIAKKQKNEKEDTQQRDIQQGDTQQGDTQQGDTQQGGTQQGDTQQGDTQQKIPNTRENRNI